MPETPKPLRSLNAKSEASDLKTEPWHHLLAAPKAELPDEDDGRGSGSAGTT